MFIKNMKAMDIYVNDKITGTFILFIHLLWILWLASIKWQNMSKYNKDTWLWNHCWRSSRLLWTACCGRWEPNVGLSKGSMLSSLPSHLSRLGIGIWFWEFGFQRLHSLQSGVAANQTTPQQGRKEGRQPLVWVRHVLHASARQGWALCGMCCNWKSKPFLSK